MGGTKIRCAVFGENGRMLSSYTIASRAYPEPDDNIENLIATLDRLISPYPVEHFRGIGIGLPGTVDNERGLVVYTPNLQWVNLPIAQRLKDKLGLPVSLIQDVAAAVWGEYQFGAGHGIDNLVCATIGTGIACGILINGRLYGGTNHTAGEIGHLHIADDDLVCGCGNAGCLEACASGLGLVKLFRKAVKDGGSTPLTTRMKAEDINAYAIFDAARGGDELCLSIIDQMARYLAKGLSHVATILAPELLLLSGGLSKESSLLVEPLKKYFYNYSYRSVRENVRIELASLGEDAPLVGAAFLHRADDYSKQYLSRRKMSTKNGGAKCQREDGHRT